MKNSSPKVIAFIIADSLRYDTCYPYIKEYMPYIFNNSTHFHQVRSPGCWTLPSHVSMFTGKWLHEHGQNTQIRRAGHNFPMLAEILKENGYYNLMITSNLVVTDIFGINKGFDETRRIWKELKDQSLGFLVTLLGYVWRPRLRKRFIKSFIHNKMAEDVESLRTFFKSYAVEMLELAKKRVNELLDQNKKVFLFINFYDFHFPYQVNKRFSFEEKGIKNRYLEFKSLLDIINNNHMKDISYRPNLEMLNKIKDRQRRSFKRVGKDIDEFAKWLRERESNSTIVFSSDHGENFGEEKWLYHFGNVTEGGNRVPLTWSSPGQTGKTDISLMVSLKDVFNSFLSETGINPKNSWHLKDHPENSITLMEAIWYDAKGKTADEYKRNQFAFVTKKDKYIYRQNKWFYTPLGIDSENGNLKSLDNIDPIEEADLDQKRKKEIQIAWRNFIEFEKKISN